MTRLVLIAGAACALAGTARADSLVGVGATDDGRVVELGHRVDVEIADRTATFHVERELSNTGGGVVRAELSINTPTRAVARSFQLLAGDRWIDGQLATATAASDEFARLTTTGVQLAHGPAVMEWVGDGSLLVRAYPLPPGGRLRLRYTLEAPVCFTAGRWIADYPMAIPDDDMAPIILHAPGARVFTAAQLEAELGHTLDEACGADVPITADGAHRYVVLDVPGPESAPADVRFARASAGGADLVRMSIDLSREIAPAPHGARVVFVVDASRSMDDAGIADQLAWIAGYLAHVPDASFEIVLYRRWPERVFGRFEPAAHAAERIAAIDPARLRPGNGSHFDRGLEVAAQLLVPAGGPRRVVAFTDEQWRPDWDAPRAEAALAALPADAIVHLIDLSASDPQAPPSIDRADDDALAAVAARWGGIAASVAGGSLAPRAAFATAALVLVRPLRIDHAMLRKGGAAADDEELGALEENTGVYRSWSAKGRGAIAIDGLIWGRAWRRELTGDAAASRRWAGELIADPVRDDLSDEQVLALATMGAVVSPMTSFLAVDRRYPPAGLPEGWGEGDICGCDTNGGTIGRSISTSSTCGGFGVSVETPDPAILAALIAPRAGACAAQHHQRAWQLVVGIDTTGAEIVDVQVRSRILDAEALPGDPGDADAFEACIEDAAWDLNLDDRFARFTRHYDAIVAGTRP